MSLSETETEMVRNCVSSMRALMAYLPNANCEYSALVSLIANILLAQDDPIEVYDQFVFDLKSCLEKIEKRKSCTH